MPIKVELLDRMGSDKTVVDAARISYNRIRAEFAPQHDIPLLNKLAEEGHWSPFYHPQLQFRITAPMFVAAQLKRHHIGLALNELSRRYTMRDFTFTVPLDISVFCQAAMEKHWHECYHLYRELHGRGVPLEQARAVLPQMTDTVWIWTGSLFAFVKMAAERTHPTTQRETRLVAGGILGHAQEHFPNSLNALWHALYREE